MLNEFKKFLLRGNVLDLAIGVIIGTALTGVVKSLSSGIIMPLVNLFMYKIDLSHMYWKVGAVKFLTGEVLQAIISFVITGFVLFMIVKAVNKFMKKNEDSEEAIIPNEELETLKDIRDLLQHQND